MGVKTVLVTGGGGYIGSHFVKLLLRRGYQAVVIDNLENGHRDAALCDSFYEGELEDRALLNRIFSSHAIDAVAHFAAYMYVAESMANPRKYWERNTEGLLRLLGACDDHGVSTFLYSSSCSVYGAPTVQPITEGETGLPINPYGWTKYVGERILESYRHTSRIRPVALRYFNVAGADPENQLGERHKHEIHAIPLLLEAAANGGRFAVFGTTYDTRDGTCIRDYIHVWDLARAHLLALEYVQTQVEPWIFNLGTGRGASVLELIAAVEAVTGRLVNVDVQGPRAGDPPVLVADASLARTVLGWQPEFADINAIVKSAWRYMQASTVA
jgi:UDP-glucose-4-epimerase GalE